MTEQVKVDSFIVDFKIQWNPITIQLCMLGPRNPGCSLKELYNKVFTKGVCTLTNSTLN